MSQSKTAIQFVLVYDHFHDCITWETVAMAAILERSNYVGVFEQIAENHPRWKELLSRAPAYPFLLSCEAD